MSEEFATMCAYENIRSHPTPAKAKRYNGVAEQANWTLAEKERCLRTYAALPRSTWVNSAEHACQMHNISPSSGSYESPYFRWYGVHPSTANLHVYGTECYYHDSEFSSSQGGNPSEVVRFIGYTKHSRSTYKLYRPSTGRVLYSCNVSFIERPLKMVSPFDHQSDYFHDESDDDIEFSNGADKERFERVEQAFEERKDIASTPTDSSKLPGAPDPAHTGPAKSERVPEIAGDGQQDHLAFDSRYGSSVVMEPSLRHEAATEASASRNRSENTPLNVKDPTLKLRRSKRTVKPVDRLLYMLSMCCMVYEPSITKAVSSQSLPDDRYDHSNLCSAVFDEPLSYSAARRSAESTLWVDAMEEELEGLTRQGTWSIVDTPEGANLMKTKWVY